MKKTTKISIFGTISLVAIGVLLLICFFNLQDPKLSLTYKFKEVRIGDIEVKLKSGGRWHPYRVEKINKEKIGALADLYINAMRPDSEDLITHDVIEERGEGKWSVKYPHLLLAKAKGLEKQMRFEEAAEWYLQHADLVSDPLSKLQAARALIYEAEYGPDTPEWKTALTEKLILKYAE